MVGLRTQESSKFLRFWDLVQRKARELNKTFFLDCGEGNTFENQTIECENLSGWLIDDDKLADFQKLFENNIPINEDWENSVAFVVWSLHNGKITVEFE